MARNRTNDTLENRLVSRIAELERVMREGTTPQPVGGDIVDVIAYPDSPLINGPYNVAAGQMGFLGIGFFPQTPNLTQWTFSASLTVDALGSQNCFPSGLSLSAGQRKARFSFWTDRVNSDPTQNYPFVMVTFENTDTVAHNYYVYLQAFVPKIAIQ